MLPWLKGSCEVQAIQSSHTRGSKPPVGCKDFYKWVSVLCHSESSDKLINQKLLSKLQTAVAVKS